MLLVITNHYNDNVEHSINDFDLILKSECCFLALFASWFVLVLYYTIPYMCMLQEWLS